MAARLCLMCLLFLVISCTNTQVPDSENIPIVLCTNPIVVQWMQSAAGHDVLVVPSFAHDEDPAYVTPTAEDIVSWSHVDAIVEVFPGYAQFLQWASLPESGRVYLGKAEQRLASKDASHRHGPQGDWHGGQWVPAMWMDYSLALSMYTTLDNFVQKKYDIHLQESQHRQRLQSLHQRMTKQAAHLSSWQVIVSHPVYDYWSRAYNVPISACHIEPHEPITDLDEITALQQGALPVLFIWEAEPSEANAARIAALGWTQWTLPVLPSTGSDWITEQEGALTRLLSLLK